MALAFLPERGPAAAMLDPAAEKQVLDPLSAEPGPRASRR
jgi:hypothetical protein